MKDMILLGAGASKEAGLKDTKGMTLQMLEMSSEEDGQTHSRRTRLLRFVVGGLVFQHGVKGENPLTKGVNVENVFNAIDLLWHRREAEFAPFVSSWHPVIDELTRTVHTPPSSYEIDKAARDLVDPPFTDIASRPFALSNFSDIISRTSRAGVTTTDESLFKETMEWMIRSLIKMVRITEPEKVKYLVPLLHVSGNEKRVIATLNYDSSMELAAKKEAIPINLGIDDWAPGYYPLTDSGVQLIKLHGSANWELSEVKPSNQDPIPRTKIVIHTDDGDKQLRYKPAVVFGGANKLTVRGPFLDLLNAFRDELKRTDQLTVIGYSFHDQHINECIDQFLAGRSTRLRIINGTNFVKSADGYAQEILDPRRRPDLRDRIQDRSLKASDGIQQCFGTN